MKKIIAFVLLNCWGISLFAQWQSVAGQAHDVGVGANGTVWVIGWTPVPGGFNIGRWNGSYWENIPGGAVRIDVDPSGNAWIVNDAGLIFRWNGRTWDGIGGQAHDIGIGANGTVWVIGWTAVPGGYNIARWNGSYWEDIPGGAVRIDVDPNGNAWITNDAGLIFRWNGRAWDSIGGQAHDVGIGADGIVWVIGWTAVPGGYNIGRWTGSSWANIEGGLNNISGAPNGSAWGTNTDGVIWKWSSNSNASAPAEITANAFKHTATTGNTTSNWTAIDNPATNNNPNALLQISPFYRDVYNASVSGVWYNNGKWTVFNQDIKPMPKDMQYHVMVEYPSATAFLHTATAANTAGHVTTLDHPQLNDHPDALILITQNWGNNGPYNPHELGVWYNNGRWKIYNEDRVALPLNAKFNVSIQTGRATLHTATNANIFGQVLSATETNISDPDEWVFTTHNYGSGGPYNTNPTGIFYAPGHSNWAILTGNTARMPLGARFNVLAVRSPAISHTLWGFADLHTHPAIHLAFGANGQGKNLIWGSPGLGLSSSNIATDLPPCNHDEHAWDEIDITRRETRKLLANTLTGDYTGYTHGPGGYPSFSGWPNARSVIHQQMHISWIRRAYDGGLRLMVASVTENQLIAKLWNRGGFDGGIAYDPNYDFNSARTQLAFILRMAAANADWMEIVTSAAQARTVISNNRLAVVLALEMDGLTVEQINALSDEFGVRLVTPIHMMNNSIGGAAAYSNIFNSNNKFSTGNFYHVKADTSLDFRLARPGVLNYEGAGIWQRIIPLVRPLIPIVNLLPLAPLDFFMLLGPEAGIMSQGGISDAEYRELGYDCEAGTPSVGNCVNPCDGHKNVLGIRKEQLGRLMQRGMLIDLAHMSEESQKGALDLSEQFNYPMLDSHTGIRTTGGSERSILDSDTRRMAARGGVIGMGTEGGNYPRKTIYFRSASPVVRFTGSLQRWTDGIGPQSGIPGDGIIRQLVITVRTGGDDLRGNNDNAIGMLIGAPGNLILDNLDLNQRAGWAGGSIHTVTIAVPGSVRRLDVRQFGVRTTFGGGIGGDNWNMDEIKVEAFDNAGNHEVWIDRRGAPLNRFTGSNKTWVSDLPGSILEIPNSAIIQRVDFTIRTGGDDLRGGNDNASAVLVLLGCQNRPVKVDLNRGATWGGGSTNNVSWTPPAGSALTKADLVGFRLETTSGGGLSGDNWNVDELIVRVTTNNGSYDLVREVGSPFMRFTGEVRGWERMFNRLQNVPDNATLRCLQLTINTGGDDLRGANDNAFAIIELTNGAQHEFPLNLQGTWKNGSSHSNILCLPNAITRDQLKSLTIRTTFGGGIDGDNWNIDAIQLDAIMDDPVAVWTKEANSTLTTMGNKGFAFGSDINGLAPQMPFTTQNVQYPLNYQPQVNISGPSIIGTKTLNFTQDGMAHVGMYPEFIQLIRQSPNGAPVVNALFHSAEDFVTMWERVEAAAPAVNLTSIQNQVVTLNITLQTGGDDLRGGNDNAYGYVYLRDGGFYEFPLNNGANWGGNSRNTVNFALPYGKTQNDIVVFGIRTTSGGGLSGDNWNLDRVEIQSTSVNGGTAPFLTRSGAPLVRFTGSNQNWRANL